MAIQLDWTREELEAIGELVTARLAELYSEIRHARVTDFRDELKDHKHRLEEIQTKIKGALSIE